MAATGHLSQTRLKLPPLFGSGNGGMRDRHYMLAYSGNFLYNNEPRQRRRMWTGGVSGAGGVLHSDGHGWAGVAVEGGW